MKFWIALALGALCVGAGAAAAKQGTIAVPDDQSLRRADDSAFGPGVVSYAITHALLDANFSWTDSNGHTRDKSDVLKTLKDQFVLDVEAGSEVNPALKTTARAYGQLGVVQQSIGNLYVLRVWVKRAEGWQLLIYHAVRTGAPAPAGPQTEECENPCKTVPFQPKNQDEADVIQAYQSVERAVTAHNSAAWGAHIADEFFAVTSNSDRPLDKSTRMAGLDNQKVAGIAPFPLASARMYEFGDAMVMISTQQPQHGDPLHVTRIWFKRGGAWLEAYSYQTTIQNVSSVR
jgi:hypothetical protein